MEPRHSYLSGYSFGTDTAWQKEGASAEQPDPESYVAQSTEPLPSQAANATVQTSTKAKNNIAGFFKAIGHTEIALSAFDSAIMQVIATMSTRLGRKTACGMVEPILYNTASCGLPSTLPSIP